MIAVVAGGSGLVGSALVEKLLQDSDFSKVVCLVRKPLGYKNQKLEEVVTANFADLHTYEKDLRGDVYFCCLGSTLKKAGSKEAFRMVDYTAVVEFARVAKSNQSRAFLMISASGANEKSKIFYSRIKGEADKTLCEMSFKKLIIFRPGLLIGDRKESRPTEKFAIGSAKTLSLFFPKSILRRFVTEVDLLSSRMKDESKNLNPGTVIIESTKI